MPSVVSLSITHVVRLFAEVSYYYWNPRTGLREPVQRHIEIPDLLARKICPALEIPQP
jgi:hypothetical protein